MESVVFQAGRPPWYLSDGSSERPVYLVGICGGSASGKTSVSERIIRQLNASWVALVSMDSFYKSLDEEKLKLCSKNSYNFDHPDAFDFELLYESLKKLKSGRPVEIPIYDFKTHSRSSQTRLVYGANVIVFEGIFTFHDRSVRDLMDIKIFVDTDDDVRLVRRRKGRTIESVLMQYNRFVKPSFDEFIRPTVKYADVIIPRGVENIVAVDLITKLIGRQLEERGLSFRQMLADTHQGKEYVPSNLILLKQTKQIKSILTIIRDRKTDRNDFIFYANRLCTLVVEIGLSELSFKPITVNTPLSVRYNGYQPSRKLCGVAIERAGVAMERGLRKVCKDIKIGKLLIQTDKTTGDPKLHFCRLPSDIKDRQVILMDTSLATGAAMIMAIRVLLDHDVKQEDIIVLTLITSPLGLHSLSYAFPLVKIIAAEVDNGLNDNMYIVPGFGNFADRYFGT